MLNVSQLTPGCAFVRFLGFELQIDAEPALMARRGRGRERRKGKERKRERKRDREESMEETKCKKIDLNLDRFIHFGEGSHVFSCLPPTVSIPRHPSQFHVSCWLRWVFLYVFLLGWAFRRKHLGHGLCQNSCLSRVRN